jgi:flavin reductase (DIM6/NTAB) family NADH-FMN oxidoreductase RutF
MTFSADQFRQLMRQHPAAVTVIATGAAPNRTGLTATAVMSLSAEPASIVCAVNRSSFTCAKIIENKSFSMNTLASHQIELASTFAGQTALAGELRFKPDDWCMLETGAPVLRHAVISLDCELMQAVETGTHMLLLGRVVAGRQSADESALIYVDGNWAGVDHNLATI